MVAAVSRSTWQLQYHYYIPPQQFDFINPDGWPRWIKCFEHSRVASGLSERSEPVQINTMIYVMGEQTDDIFTSFRLSDEQAKQYSVVKNAFRIASSNVGTLYTSVLISTGEPSNLVKL